jgi:hypothetical protein
MPKPHRLIPRAVAEKRQAVRRVLDDNLGYEDDIVDALPPEVRRDIAALIQTARRALPPESGRIFGKGFNMIDIDEYNYVVDQLLKLPAKSRPQDTLRVFVKLVGYLGRGTAEILLSRQQFADQCGIAPRNVSTAMTTLANLGVIRREGSGRSVTYYVNANLLFNGDPERHKIEAAKSKRPSLQVIEGGAAHD